MGSISNLNFSSSSQTLPVSATVSAPNYTGNTTPSTGTVTFTVTDSSNTTVATLPGVAVSSGTASGNVTIPASQAAGNYSVVAAYTGAGSYSSSSSASTFSISGPTNLSIAKGNSGTFTQGQTGGVAGNGAFTFTVSNTGGASSGTITVTDTLPTGWAAASFSPTGWSCVGSGTPSGNSFRCIYTQVVAANASAPTLTVNVSVPANSPVSITNQAAVYGGGDPVNTSSSPALSNVDSVTVV